MTETNHPSRLAAWLEAAWLERYLDRQLTAEEAAWFETYVIDKLDLLQKIDADSDLRDGVMGVGITAENDMVEHKIMELPVVRSRQPVPRMRFGAQATAWAASLILGVGIGVLATRHADSLALRSAEIIVNPTRMFYDTQRGAERNSEVAHIDHKASNSSYVLIEQSVPSDAASIVLRADGQEDRELRPSSDGLVSFLFARASVGKLTNLRIEYVTHGTKQSVSIPTNGIEEETR